MTKIEKQEAAMKKTISLLISVAVMAGLLAGCGTDYYTADSTVFVSKKGRVVSTDVEQFDTSTYKVDDLQEYVDQSIDTYNDKNDGSVKLKKLTVEDSKASLTIKYDSAEEYTGFNGIELFAGTIAEALAAGYDFKVDFAAIDDGKAKTCDTSEFMDDDGYKVVVYKGNSNIHVDGKILYASIKDVKLVDDKTVSIKTGYNLLTSGHGSTESVTEQINGTEVNATEAVEGTENSDGSVSDDDILNSVQEETEVTFDFDSEEDTSEAVSYITYVIYK